MKSRINASGIVSRASVSSSQGTSLDPRCKPARRCPNAHPICTYNRLRVMVSWYHPSSRDRLASQTHRLSANECFVTRCFFYSVDAISRDEFCQIPVQPNLCVHANHAMHFAIRSPNHEAENTATESKEIIVDASPCGVDLHLDGRMLYTVNHTTERFQQDVEGKPESA